MREKRSSGTLSSWAAGFVFLVMLLLAASTSLFGITLSECMECHSDPEMVIQDSLGKTQSLFVDLKVYKMSVHGSFECVDCHTGITELPHIEDLPEVNCGSCHQDVADIYEWHGFKRYGEDPDIPLCQDCHGSHDVFKSSVRESRVNPLNIPTTCGRCHEDIDLVKKHGIPLEKPVEFFESSIHGKSSLGGVYLAATCNDCHSTNGTAHIILPPGDPQSSINHFIVPKTCGRCHKSVENDYWEGIHGQMTRRGETDSPVCTDCHGEHGILSPSDPRSPVSPTRIAEATCSPCHESARLNEKFGVPTGRLKTWVDSYHGLKSKTGDITVANCASCHGAHRILPSSDSSSSTYTGNLQKTCGHCHPGISATLAKVPIHGTPGMSSTPAANIIRNFYIIAIVVIIGTMVLHWVIDLRVHLKKVVRKGTVIRMNYNEVWQHMFLTVTFVVLVITGFSLRFSEAAWVKLLFGWEGGFPIRGTIHRVAAVVFILAVLWHVLYLTTDRGKRFFRDIFPRKKDLGQFFQMVSYNLGLTGTPPGFGKFSYVEKAEYWALVWGTLIMIISGFFLWFDNVAVKWFPKGFLDVMLVVHYYEAWLATLAILIWHMYSVIFRPGVYPMNPAWLTGKMPEEMYRHEHPEAVPEKPSDAEQKE